MLTYCRKKNGFTLIEILVVILIISITAGFIEFSGAFNNKERQLQHAAMEFKMLMDYAQQQAIYEFAEIGVVVSANGYQFMRYRMDDANTTAEWVNIDNDDLLTAYTMPSKINLQLRVTNKTDNNSGPAIVLSSDGDVTPFNVDFSLENNHSIFRVATEKNGSIQMQELGKK